MRVMALRQHGGPEVLREEELPRPAPGRHQLLVEVHATSVNPVDTKIRRGGGAARSMPIVLGYDASGVVRARGADTDGWSEGELVFGCPNLFDAGADADYVLLDSRAAAKKPGSVDHATAACLPLVSLTAWEALHERARIEAGQTVLIHAGAGGVGHIAVQLARLHGCRVIFPRDVVCSYPLWNDETTIPLGKSTVSTPRLPPTSWLAASHHRPFTPSSPPAAP